MRDRNKAWTVEEASDGFYQVVVPSEVTGWRTQAKLVAANKSSSWTRDGCQFGLYQRGTHKLLPIPNCQVHHPSINRAVALLEQATAKVGTSAYNEESREGSLRYVQLQVERTSGKVCLTLIWNAADLKQTQPALARLIKELNRLDPTLWHSMWCHLNDGLGNNIFSRNPSRWHRLFGVEYMREPLPVGDVGWLYFSPMSFRQGNLDGFDILANDVARAVPGGSKVCELYAGVGTLGLTALVHHESFEGERPLEWIRCSDENPNSARCFYRSCDSLPPHITGRVDKSSQRTKSQGDDEEGMSLAELAQMMQTGIRPFHGKQEQKAEKTSYVIASAAKALKMGQALGANVLIVDPPRKGLEEEVLAELCMPFNPDQPYVESATLLTIPDEEVNWTNDVQTLIYVSCGFDGLARDCDALLSSKEGGWVLQSATGYILFPGSDHVETVAIFQRK
jgi:tRNA/tmRNA/rRNA uracil-C5-methylase (TrmA/RlmC/RlmD family)